MNPLIDDGNNFQYRKEGGREGKAVYMAQAIVFSPL